VRLLSEVVEARRSFSWRYRRHEGARRRPWDNCVRRDCQPRRPCSPVVHRTGIIIPEEDLFLKALMLNVDAVPFTVK
jgi:hypothetical protein